MGASWAVVATVDEPAPLVAAFVAHHLNEGAREVHLFLDKPDPETVALIRDMKGCKLKMKLVDIFLRCIDRKADKV